MAEKQLSKKARVSELAGLKFVSDAALAAILKAIGQKPAAYFSENISRWTVDRSLSSLASIETAAGPRFQTIDLVLSDGTPFAWELIAPAALLNHLCATSQSFSQYLEEMVTQWCSHLQKTLTLISDSLC